MPREITRQVPFPLVSSESHPVLGHKAGDPGRGLSGIKPLELLSRALANIAPSIILGRFAK